MDPEQTLLMRAADRYKDQGYEVIVKPKAKDLPTFARDFAIDIVAKKGSHGIVVVVKKDIAALRKDGSLSRLAEFVNAQPGWRFDLTILEPTTPIDEAAVDAKELSPKQLDQFLTRIEDSAKAGDSLSAYILAWSALEVAMRHKIRVARIEGPEVLSPTVLIRVLTAEDNLSHREMKMLDKNLKMRNQVVHGFAQPKIKTVDVAYIVSLARRLVTEKKPIEDD